MKNLILIFYQNLHESSSITSGKVQQNRDNFGEYYQKYQLTDCLHFIEEITGFDSENALKILQAIGGQK